MTVKYSRFYLERTLRKFASLGSGIKLENCILSHDGGTAPDEPYCALTYVGENRAGQSFYWDDSIPNEYDTEDGIDFGKGRTRKSEVVNARYMLQFFREDSYAAAQKFVTFADSHYGIAWASNAVIDGKLHKVYVYPSPNEHGKSKLYNIDEVNEYKINIPFDAESQDDNKSNAEIVLYATRSRKIEGGIVTNNGHGFSEEVKVDISVLDQFSDTPDLPAPKIVVSGQGFAINRPIMIEQIDEIVSADFERRTVVELDIMFKYDTIDRMSIPVEPYELDKEDKNDDTR